MSDQSELCQTISQLAVADQIKAALRVLAAALADQADQDDQGILTWRVGETDDSRGVSLSCFSE